GGAPRGGARTGTRRGRSSPGRAAPRHPTPRGVGRWFWVRGSAHSRPSPSLGTSVVGKAGHSLNTFLLTPRRLSFRLSRVGRSRPRGNVGTGRRAGDRPPRSNAPERRKAGTH